VISSITEPHEYDEIHIPWGIATSVLRIHVLNKLLKRGYDVNRAIEFINVHAQKYNKELDDVFKELIAESPNRGIETISQRNPSLERGSVQLTRITKVKTDPNIPTVSISILIVKGLNADFDGDAINFSLAIDNYVADAYKNLEPHKSVFSLDEPFKVSSNLSMPKPVISTISNFIGTPLTEEDFDPVKIAAMQCIPEYIENNRLQDRRQEDRRAEV
jgi:hypothetical protein